MPQGQRIALHPPDPRRDLKRLWSGNSLGDRLLEACVLGGLLLAGAAVAARLFRWE